MSTPEEIEAETRRLQAAGPDEFPTDYYRAMAEQNIGEESLAEDLRRILADHPGCWVLRAEGLTCTDMVGATFRGTTAVWTEDMCCLPCRIRALLAERSAPECECELLPAGSYNGEGPTGFEQDPTYCPVHEEHRDVGGE